MSYETIKKSSTLISQSWSYTAEPDALSDIVSVTILMWNNGICVVGIDKNKTVLTTATYHINIHNIAALENLILNLPVLAGPQPIKNIWMIESRNVIVPDELFENTSAVQWLQKLHFVEADEVVQHDDILSIKAKAAYPVKKELKELLQRYFQDATICLLSAKSLNLDEEWNAESFAYIILVDDEFVLCIIATGRILVHQTGKYKTIEDIVYKIGLAAENYGMENEQINISLFGIGVDLVQYSHQLQEYFPKANLIEDSNEAYLKFLSTIS